MKLGIECIKDYRELFKGKRVGLITNPTGITCNFESSIDVLRKETNLVGLFSPEHGVRANIQAGAKLDTYVDEETNITVYSLYGETKKPTKEMMDKIDVMCIDIQDVGARFYTFIYTMAYAMIACSEEKKPFVVFDRPNPVNADDIEGNILDLECRSFIGYYPILQRHGMTIGELAMLFNQEYGINCDLKVIKMEGYDRKLYFDELNCPWIAPSPNIPTVTSSIAYLATCIFEGTNIAEGRGTTQPFEIVGAPFIKPTDLANALNACNLPGVYFRPMYFTPTFAKFEKQMCGGVQLHITDRKVFKAIKTGWVMLDVIRKLYPNDCQTSKPYIEGRPGMLEYNTGCTYVKAGLNIDVQLELLEKDTKEFANTRQKYLLY